MVRPTGVRDANIKYGEFSWTHDSEEIGMRPDNATFWPQPLPFNAVEHAIWLDSSLKRVSLPSPVTRDHKR